MKTVAPNVAPDEGLAEAFEEISNTAAQLLALPSAGNPALSGTRAL